MNRVMDGRTMMLARNSGSTRLAAIGRMTRSRGFTLMELVIVVAIIAILAASAYPTYTRYITKARRNAAMACLSEHANYMERYYTTHLRYDKDPTTDVANNLTNTGFDCASTSQTGTWYSYGFAAAPALSPSTYKILATPLEAQATRDAQCGVLGLDQSGQRYYQSTLEDSAGLATCWQH